MLQKEWGKSGSAYLKDILFPSLKGVSNDAQTMAVLIDGGEENEMCAWKGDAPFTFEKSIVWIKEFSVR